MTYHERRLLTAMILLCLPLLAGGLRPGAPPPSEGSTGNSQVVYEALTGFVDWSAQARPVDLDERARHFNAVQIPLAAAALDEAERPLDTFEAAPYRAMVRWQFWLAKHLDPGNQGAWQANPSVLATTRPVTRTTTAVLPALEMLQLESLAHMAWRRDHIFDALVWWRDRGVLQRRIARDLYDPSTGGYARYDSLGRRQQEPGNLADLLPLALDAPTDLGAARALAMKLLVDGEIDGPNDARARAYSSQRLDPASGWPLKPGLDLLSPEQSALLLSRAVARLYQPALNQMTDETLRELDLLMDQRMPLNLGEGWTRIPLPGTQPTQLERTRVAIHFLKRTRVLTPEEAQEALLTLDSSVTDSLEQSDALATQLELWADAWSALDPYERQKLQVRYADSTPVNGEDSESAFGFRDNDVIKWMPEAVDLIHEDAQALRLLSRRNASYAARIVPEVVARDHRPSMEIRFERVSDAQRGVGSGWTGAWTNGLVMLADTPLKIRNSDHLVAWTTLPALPDEPGLWWLVVRGPLGAPEHAPACALVDPLVATVRAVGRGDGHQRRFEVRIENQLVGELNAEYEVATPEGWEIYPEATRELVVPSRSAVEWKVELRAPKDEAPGHYPVEWRFYDGHELVAVLQEEFAVHFDWIRIGPFAAGVSDPLAGRNPPENQIRLDEEYTGTRGKVSWQHLDENALAPDGWVDLGHGEPGEVWYGLTAVSTTTSDARVLLESVAPALIRLNGDEVGRTVPRRRTLDAPIELSTGANYLLVKAVIGEDGAARVRLALRDLANAPLRTADYRLEHLIGGIAFLPGAGEDQRTPENQERAEMRLVLISYRSPSAQSVAVVGDFNGWSPEADPMVRQEDGTWRTEVRLRPGEFQYKLVVDGDRWIRDPANPKTVADGFGELNSVLRVR